MVRNVIEITITFPVVFFLIYWTTSAPFRTFKLCTNLISRSTQVYNTHSFKYTLPLYLPELSRQVFIPYYTLGKNIDEAKSGLRFKLKRNLQHQKVINLYRRYYKTYLLQSIRSSRFINVYVFVIFIPSHMCFQLILISSLN